MFCYQCQETAGNQGCTQSGVCGKKPETARLQDVLLYATKGFSQVLTILREEGKKSETAWNHQVTENLFLTITNANFDNARILDAIKKTLELKADALDMIKEKEALSQAARWNPAGQEEISACPKAGVLAAENEDVRSLRELLTYGLKGMAAYLKHANTLGEEQPEIDAFLQSALAKTMDDSLSGDQLVALVMEAGKYGVDVMALLDKANTGHYGNPEITKVSIGVRKNPAILISGHDLRDLEMLLEQTQGTGVDVYTHSEMLPAHYYPAFKKYSHFAGNYGNAWWKQKEEFASFGGPILLTTNCLVPPSDSYKDRVYTTGAVGFPGCKHIEAQADGAKDFSEIIAHAKRCPAPTEIETGEITGGFAHNQVLALADQVADAVKSGAVKKFVVMAGCDGRSKSRNYYTDFAKALPEDTIILTAGCAKYKYNKLNLGDIGGHISYTSHMPVSPIKD